MKIGQAAVMGPIRQAFGGESVVGLGEGELLDRFVARRDEPAFAALVARHGPMVLGVCRRLLADPDDAEDAFQATFLVLVRRAGSIRDGDGLAPWLFGVARRVATRARIDAARRRARECPVAVEPASPPAEPDDRRRELARALTEEIDRLPESLRGAVLLCCVEGRSYEEAAGRLRCSTPAVRGRLSRARDRLKARLTRRGFAPAAGGIGVLLATELASAALPASLRESTTRAAITFAAGQAATLAGAVPATVALLAEGVIRTMIVTKSKILAAAAVALGLAGSGVGVVAQQRAIGPDPFAAYYANDLPDEPPAPPVQRAAAPPQSREADRLGSLERKIDRLIDVLDRSNPAPAPAPAPEVRTTGPDGRPIGAGRNPAGGSTNRWPGLASARSSPDEDDVSLPRPAASSRRPSVAPPSITRLDALEQKVGSFEARLSKLERRLGALDQADDEGGLPRLPRSERRPFDLDSRRRPSAPPRSPFDLDNGPKAEAPAPPEPPAKPVTPPRPRED